MRRNILIGLSLGMAASTAPSVALAQASSPARGAALRGHVLDASTREPVHLVTVTLVDTESYRVTNRAGEFVFQEIAPGGYTLRLTHIGYETRAQPDIQITATLGLDIEIFLEPKAFLLEAITVTPGSFSFMESGASGQQTMSREDIQSVPQIGEDLFRAVNRLPGLSSGDYAAHFSIRGGRHDETLILLDGLELYEPYHLKDFNEGAISIIDTETIQGVELMTGGFPAAYGNKRSGVFNITSRIPDREQSRYNVGLSFMNARAMAMGPLEGDKGSWLVSARSGYMDLVFDIINQNDLPSPRYHDVFAKLRLNLSDRQMLSFDVLYAGDTYTFDAASTTGFRDTLDTRERAKNSYGNAYVWTTLHSDLGERASVRTLASAGLVTRSRDGAEEYVDRSDPLYEITNERDFSILGLKQDWTLRLADSYAISCGADLRRLRSTDSFTNLVGQDPNDPAEDPDAFYPVRTSSSFEKTGTTLGAYLSNRWRVLDPLVLEAGGRYDHASYTGDSDVSPRISAALRLGEGRTLRAGWGHYRQVQGIDDVVALNEDDTYYRSELSEQWTAGLEQRFASGALLRIEGYYKEGSNLRPVYRNWKGGIDTFPETNEDRILVFPTSSTSKGVEVYFDQRFSKKIKLRASYALSYADEIVERIVNVNGADELTFDREHPNPQDQRHAVNVDCTYRAGRAWTLNASLAAHSGWPATLETLVPVTREDGQPDSTVRPQKIYGGRLPLYLRLDVRATRTWSTASRGDWRLFFELVNITNHSNVFGYDYFRHMDGSGDISLQRDDEQWFTILPSIGVSWSGEF